MQLFIILLWYWSSLAHFAVCDATRKLHSVHSTGTATVYAYHQTFPLRVKVWLARLSQVSSSMPNIVNCSDFDSLYLLTLTRTSVKEC
jgi:hypothetical protein